MDTVIGKQIATRRYFHISVAGTLDEVTASSLHRATAIAGAEPGVEFNVVRVDSLDDTVALLQYPDFFEEACPCLTRSWNVKLTDSRVTVRSYAESFNPPVLHRKELLLAADDPRRAAFEQLTKQLEALGCFDDPVRIGFKIQWERLLLELGFRLSRHQLLPIGNEEATASEPFDAAEPLVVARHLTALSRHSLSAPVQLLRRFGYLDGSLSVFDYGCGKGDDVRGLKENKIPVSGWDPHFAPTAQIVRAHLVNLGFVINVIEDPVERREALIRAFSLAEHLLVVSVMLATDNPGKVTHFGDGVLTSRSTFQKYYTQAELQAYIVSTLGDVPIPVAPGIFFVFKDKAEEQRFLAGRQRTRVRVRPAQAAWARPAEAKGRSRNKFHEHAALLAPLWAQCLELGREPDATEVPTVAAIEAALGSLKQALRITIAHNNPADFERSQAQRSDDLTVFFALEQFQRRKPYKALEPRLQKDVRAFFGDYTSAQERAKHALFQVARPEIIAECSQSASEQGLGWLEPSQSLQLHSSLVPRLPRPLRIYVGCAAVLYGDIAESDVIKIHIRSGKVSFMKYDDFAGRPVPRMTERAKVDLRNLTLELFRYGAEYPPPPLYRKSRYINEEFPNYAEQLAFERDFERLPLDLAGYGPSGAELDAALTAAHREIHGFRLERSQRVPNLDDACGRFLTFRHFVECGETQQVTQIANRPTNPDSYIALLDLATNIIDPVIEYFGGIDLTYGFCSRELARIIPGRVAPRVDQHAAAEHKKNGAPICDRAGAAADLFVRDEDMEEVARWIIANLPFDRLYFYGAGRPIHVSYGPHQSRAAYRMIPTPAGRTVPRPF